MNTSRSIPEAEQLEALAAGLFAVYALVERHIGRLEQIGDYRDYITVTKEQLLNHLRHNPELAERHISSPGAQHYHEEPVLERTRAGFRVYEVCRDQEVDNREFRGLSEAATEYLMWNF